MIVTINGNSRHLHSDLINQMHILRKEVFFERLKWDVEVQGDWEIDQFDDCDP